MTAWLLDALFGWLGPLLAGLAAVAGAWVAGRRAGAQAARTGALEDEIRTRRRMDDADIVGDDPDAARRWLHDRAQR